MTLVNNRFVNNRLQNPVPLPPQYGGGLAPSLFINYAAGGRPTNVSGNLIQDNDFGTSTPAPVLAPANGLIVGGGSVLSARRRARVSRSHVDLDGATVNHPDHSPVGDCPREAALAAPESWPAVRIDPIPRSFNGGPGFAEGGPWCAADFLLGFSFLSQCRRGRLRQLQPSGSYRPAKRRQRYVHRDDQPAGDGQSYLHGRVYRRPERRQHHRQQPGDGSESNACGHHDWRRFRDAEPRCLHAGTQQSCGGRRRRAGDDLDAVCQRSYCVLVFDNQAAPTISEPLTYNITVKHY